MKLTNQHLIELYRCPLHGFREDPEEFEGKWICSHFVPPEGECLEEVSGPFPAVVDLAPQKDKS